MAVIAALDHEEVGARTHLDAAELAARTLGENLEGLMQMVA